MGTANPDQTDAGTTDTTDADEIQLTGADAAIANAVARRFGVEIEDDQTDDAPTASDDDGQLTIEGGDGEEPDSLAVGSGDQPPPPDPGTEDDHAVHEPPDDAAPDDTPADEFQPVRLGALTLDTPEQAEGAAGVLAWFQSQSPETLQAIADLTSGRFALVPIEQVRADGTYAGTAPVTPPADASGQQSDPLAQFAEVEPEVAAFMREQQAEIARLRDAEQARESTTIQQEQERVRQIAIEVRQEMMTRGLSEQEVIAVEQHLVDLQVIPALVQQHNGDHRAAFLAGLEASAYMIPEIREKLIAPPAPTDTPPVVDEDARILAENNQRKRRAASVASSSGSLAHQPADPSTLPPAERAAARRSQMADEIRQMMGQ